jgi:hypothetical protein
MGFATFKVIEKIGVKTDVFGFSLIDPRKIVGFIDPASAGP